MPDWLTYKGIEVPDATPTGEAGVKLKDDLLLLADRAIASICCGRLTLESGVPVSTTDQTAKSTLYFTPYGGDEIGLYDGTDWILNSFTERSVAVPGIKFMPFDVYLYDNSGTLTLDPVNWASSQATGSITGATNATPVVITSNSHGLSNGTLVGIDGLAGNTAPNGIVWTVISATTNTFALEGSVGNGTYTSGGTWYAIPTSRSTALTTQDGVYVKTGATSRRYLGTCCTTSTSGQCEDSLVRRFVWNCSNRILRSLHKWLSSDHVYTTANVWRAWNNSIAQRVEVVQGILEDAVIFQMSGAQKDSVYATIGVNTTTATYLPYPFSSAIGSGSYITTSVGFSALLTRAGYHYLQALEQTTIGSSNIRSYGISIAILG